MRQIKIKSQQRFTCCSCWLGLGPLWWYRSQWPLKKRKMLVNNTLKHLCKEWVIVPSLCSLFCCNRCSPLTYGVSTQSVLWYLFYSFIMNKTDGVSDKHPLMYFFFSTFDIHMNLNTPYIIPFGFCECKLLFDPSQF